MDVKMSGDYKLICEATGTPTPDVRWTRNGEKDPREQVRILLVTNESSPAYIRSPLVRVMVYYIKKKVV